MNTSEYNGEVFPSRMITDSEKESIMLFKELIDKPAEELTEDDDQQLIKGYKLATDLQRREGVLPPLQILKLQAEHNKKPLSKMVQNAVTSVGIEYITEVHDRVSKIHHMFTTTLKPYRLRATNQSHSGRCWMFSALNMLRIPFIHRLDLSREFEFSQTHLFKFDKLERANKIIQSFIDDVSLTPESRVGYHLMHSLTDDGGWFNTFTNLVSKYGLIPKNVMGETALSGYSPEMNDKYCEFIFACLSDIDNFRRRTKLSGVALKDALIERKESTMQSIFGLLESCLGTTPTTFDWYFEDSRGNHHCIRKLTPSDFYRFVCNKGLCNLNDLEPSRSKIEPMEEQWQRLGYDIDFTDFVVLSCVPSKSHPYYQNYEVEHTNNVVGGAYCRVLNLPIYELEKYAKICIDKGCPVWFAGDVSSGFSYQYSCLDSKLHDSEALFGKTAPFDKANKMRYQYTTGNHAMLIIGYNVNKKGVPVNWQVENSWGYSDNEIPGADGFMQMTSDWFQDNLVQIAVPRHLLSHRLQEISKREPTRIPLWDFLAPACKTDARMVQKQQEVWQSMNSVAQIGQRKRKRMIGF